MTAVLRASGPDFDVEAFVADCDWAIATVFHRGEARCPRTQPDGRTYEESGISVVVSKAGFHQFAQQVEDATAFLTRNADAVRRLVRMPGVSSVLLDFGIAWRDVIAQSDQFPAELIRAAGACGISVVLSHYPVGNDDAPPESSPRH